MLYTLDKNVKRFCKFSISFQQDFFAEDQVLIKLNLTDVQLLNRKEHLAITSSLSNLRVVIL